MLQVLVCLLFNDARNILINPFKSLYLTKLYANFLGLQAATLRCQATF